MKVTIIAEIGVNHNGNIRLAKRLIDVASKAGADFVKFQTFKAKNLATNFAKKAKYQLDNKSKSKTQLPMLKKLELSHSQHKILINYCKKKTTCRTKTLLFYFGEKQESRCGKCDICRKRDKLEMHYTTTNTKVSSEKNLIKITYLEFPLMDFFICPKVHFKA